MSTDQQLVPAEAAPPTGPTGPTGRAGTVLRTPLRLSDGRELLYFDERPRDRCGRDRRGLEPSGAGSELRHDPLLDEWVVIAAQRQARTHLPAPADCPLCPSRSGRSTEIPAEDYDVVVFENRFPSLSTPSTPSSAGAAGGGVPGPADGGTAPLFVRRPGVGRCEVVCFTADHHTSFAGLTPRRVEVVLEAWTDRTRELSRLPGVEHVFVFENRGEEIGVTLSHPHGQVYAYPFVPPRAARLLEVARRHRARTGQCVSCAVVVAESQAGVRVVAETPRWVAFVPHAARWPFEVHLCPRRHVADLVALDDGERTEFAGIYLEVLRRFDGVFGTQMPYVAAWHQAPVTTGRDLAHLFLQLSSIRRAPDKLKYLAGSESAMGVFINDVVPERAAELLRAAAVPDPGPDPGPDPEPEPPRAG